MTEAFSEEDVVTIVTRLTRSQLVWFIDNKFVRPERGVGGHIFGRIDIARLELLCDLSQDLDLEEPALGIVISLIDQLHAARQDLAALADAVNSLPADLQSQITARLKQH
jgi:chaperone modulatory protein CbpM